MCSHSSLLQPFCDKVFFLSLPPHQDDIFYFLLLNHHHTCNQSCDNKSNGSRNNTDSATIHINNRHGGWYRSRYGSSNWSIRWFVSSRSNYWSIRCCFRNGCSCGGGRCR